MRFGRGCHEFVRVDTAQYIILLHHVTQGVPSGGRNTCIVAETEKDQGRVRGQDALQGLQVLVVQSHAPERHVLERGDPQQAHQRRVRQALSRGLVGRRQINHFQPWHSGQGFQNGIERKVRCHAAFLYTHGRQRGMISNGVGQVLHLGGRP